MNNVHCLHEPRVTLHSLVIISQDKLHHENNSYETQQGANIHPLLVVIAPARS